jgi:hypothetical protein
MKKPEKPDMNALARDAVPKANGGNREADPFARLNPHGGVSPPRAANDQGGYATRANRNEVRVPQGAPIAILRRVVKRRDKRVSRQDRQAV